MTPLRLGIVYLFVLRRCVPRSRAVEQQSPQGIPSVSVCDLHASLSGSYPFRLLVLRSVALGLFLTRNVERSLIYRLTRILLKQCPLCPVKKRNANYFLHISIFYGYRKCCT